MEHDAERQTGRGIHVKPNYANMSINTILQLQMGDKVRNKSGLTMWRFAAMVLSPLVPIEERVAKKKINAKLF